MSLQTRYDRLKKRTTQTKQQRDETWAKINKFAKKLKMKKKKSIAKAMTLIAAFAATFLMKIFHRRARDSKWIRSSNEKNSLKRFCLRRNVAFETKIYSWTISSDHSTMIRTNRARFRVKRNHRILFVSVEKRRKKMIKKMQTWRRNMNKFLMIFDFFMFIFVCASLTLISW